MRYFALIALLCMIAIVPATAAPAPQEDVPPISPENAAQLQLDTIWNTSGFSELIWRGDKLYVNSDVGVLALDPETFERQLLTDYRTGIWALAISEDGQTLATAARDEGVLVWDVGSSAEPVALDDIKTDVLALTFAGESLVTTARDMPVQLWDTDELSAEDGITGHEGGVWVLATSEDGNLIASGGGDQTIRILNQETGDISTLRGHQGSIFSLAFSPDGSLLASASADTTLRIWDVERGIPLYNERFTTEITAMLFADDETLITGTDNGVIEFWQLDRQERSVDLALTLSTPLSDLMFLDEDNPYIQALALSPDGSTLASLTEKGVQTWQADTGLFIRSWSPGLSAPPQTFAFQPEGYYIAFGAEETIILSTLSPGGTPPGLIQSHEDRVTGLAFSPDGSLLATVGDDQRGQIIDARDGEVLHTLAVDIPLTAVTFSADGNTLATAASDGRIFLWGSATGKQRDILYYDFGIKHLLYRDDGELIVSSAENATLQVWNLESYRIQVRDTPRIGGMAFIPDSRTLYTGSIDGVVRIRDVNTLRSTVREEFTAHPNAITALTISPNGDVLVTAGEDGTVILWDTDTHSELIRFQIAPVTELHFNPAGTRLAALDSAGHIWFWQVPR